MSLFMLDLAAILAPVAVWGLIIILMARASGVARPLSLVGSKYSPKEILTASALSPEEEAEELHARARLVNALYEDDYNYHRAA